MNVDNLSYIAPWPDQSCEYETNNEFFIGTRVIA